MDRPRQAKKRSTREFKARYRAYALRRSYGITIEQYNAMLLSQEGACAICRSTEPRWHRGWHVDHDHATGRVRGILCASCNRLLGAAKDNLGVLAAAISYLTKEQS